MKTKIGMFDNVFHIEKKNKGESKYSIRVQILKKSL